MSSLGISDSSKLQCWPTQRAQVDRRVLRNQVRNRSSMYGSEFVDRSWSNLFQPGSVRCDVKFRSSVGFFCSIRDAAKPLAVRRAAFLVLTNKNAKIVALHSTTSPSTPPPPRKWFRRSISRAKVTVGGSAAQVFDPRLFFNRSHDNTSRQESPRFLSSSGPADLQRTLRRRFARHHLQRQSSSATKTGKVGRQTLPLSRKPSFPRCFPHCLSPPNWFWATRFHAKTPSELAPCLQPARTSSF